MNGFIFLAKAEEKGFWDDYKGVKNSWGSLGKNYISGVSGVATGIFTVVKILWWIALFTSIIAFLISVAELVIHAEDTPHLKERAKHDLFAALISLVILSAVGIIFTLIISFV